MFIQVKGHVISSLTEARQLDLLAGDRSKRRRNFGGTQSEVTLVFVMGAAVPRWRGQLPNETVGVCGVIAAPLMGVNGRDVSCSPLAPYAALVPSPYVTVLMWLMGSVCRTNTVRSAQRQPRVTERSRSQTRREL